MIPCCVRGGLDYERGDFDSSQSTISLGIDKLFRNSPFSLNLQGEHARKSGDFEIDKSDTRGLAAAALRVRRELPRTRTVPHG